MTKSDEGHHNEDDFYQLSKEQLVEIIKTLQSEMARLKESLKLDSKTSSKPQATRCATKTLDAEISDNLATKQAIFRQDEALKSKWLKQLLSFLLLG